MTQNQLAYDFLELMKSQLNRYCSSLDYFVFGDHVSAKLTNSKIYNLNLYVEIPRNMETYEHFLHQLPQCSIDIYKLLNPNVKVICKNNNGFYKSYEFYTYGNEPLFCFNYVFDFHLNVIPLFNHELLAQDKIGNVVLLETHYPLIHDKIFALLSSVNEKRLICTQPYDNNGHKLHHNEMMHYLRSVRVKLRSNWKVYEPVNFIYQKECVICYESFTREVLVELNCNHHFHINCFIKYLENDHESDGASRYIGIRVNHKCPTCKQDITKLKIRYYKNNRHEQKTILQPLQKYAKGNTG